MNIVCNFVIFKPVGELAREQQCRTSAMVVLHAAVADADMQLQERCLTVKVAVL